MKKIVTLFFTLLYQLAFAQVDLDTERFTLERTTDQLYLTDRQSGDRLAIMDMDSWSDPMFAIETTIYQLEGYALGWSEKVISFEIDGQTILYMEAYENGSRSSFLLSYRGKTLDTWWLQGRDFVDRTDTCTKAYGKYYLLADVNADGKPDIGVVEEEVYCKDEQVNFNTRPITWHLWHQYWWRSEIYTGELKNLDYVELGPSAAVEEVGMEYWQTYNPLSWHTESPTSEIFIPATRIQRAIDEAKLGKDRKTVKELRNYQNPLRTLRHTHTHTKKYARNDIKDAAERLLRKNFPDSLMPYFGLSESLYSYQLYDYLGRYADTYDNTSFETDSTRGIFLSATIRFKFDHPDLPWAKKDVSITLDSSLNLAYPPDYNVVPGFLTGGPDFISDEKAMEIGNGVLLPTDEEWLTATLEYDHDLKAYYWRLYKKYRDYDCVYLTGFCDLHAESGEELMSDIDMWEKEDFACE